MLIVTTQNFIIIIITITIIIIIILAVVEHTFNPSTPETEAGRSLWVQGQPGL